MNGDLLNAAGTILVGLATLMTAITGYVTIARKTRAKSYDSLDTELNTLKQSFEDYKDKTADEFDQILKTQREEIQRREEAHRRDLDERDAHHDNQIREFRERSARFEGALIASVYHIYRLERTITDKGDTPPIRPHELTQFIEGMNNSTQGAT
ncbi:putative membrane protein [Rhodococcus phage Mbo2]|uniref:Membrane protein n=1 Tax=Rhodococcus phage Mbo2 TaxID=2936911 RepID=A0A9E7IEF1_9CAUD|nr:putative membrane protein [Rhodococcus phage Mbo2]